MGRQDDNTTTLLDRKTMDGPVVKFTVADLFKSNPKLFLVYHVLGTPYDIFNTAGVLLDGAAWYGLGIGRTRFPSALAFMGTTGLISGCAGMALGSMGLLKTATKGDRAVPIPWNDDGIRQRVDGLSHNYKIRMMDLCVWSGLGLAALWYYASTIVKSKNALPPRMQLSAGWLGLLQALSLGSAAGGLFAIAAIVRAEKAAHVKD